MNYYIVNGKMRSSDELFHGRDIRYVDLDPDVLVHWKYIKRVKLPNGKYRYYYDNSYLKKQEQKIKDYQLNSFRESAKVVNAEEDMRRAAETSNSKGYLKAYEERNSAMYRAKTYNEAGREAVRKYEAMKVTAFVAKTIVKGLNAVSSFLHKLFGKRK